LGGVRIWKKGFAWVGLEKLFYKTFGIAFGITFDID